MDQNKLHWVHPKSFPSQWYVWHKPRTYLAPTLTPSPNGAKQDSTCASSLRSTIGCVQNNFRAYGTLGAIRAPILHQLQRCIQTDRNKNWPDPRHLGVPSSMSKIILSLLYVRCKPCTYLALRLALSPNGPNRASTWASSRRSSIGFVKHDFWAYGMFGANRAPILQWH
jgi:hypothetical protein